MRVPNFSYSNTLVSQLQSLTARQTMLHNQVATGQRITNPSDDPAATARVLRLQGEKQEIQQFARNNDRALNVSQSSFSTIKQLKTISDRAGELSVLGTGTASPDALSAYGTEAGQMLEQALQTANTQYAGEHLFGGTKTDTAPFTATRDATGKITGVTYNGAANGAQIRVSEGSTVTPFTNGTQNQKLADFMNNMVALRDALQSGSVAAVQSKQAPLQTSENDLLVTMSNIGATQTRLEADRSQNEARFADLENLTAAETDVNIPDTVVKLTQAQSAYQAALQSGSKLLQLSLMDYVR